MLEFFNLFNYSNPACFCDEFRFVLAYITTTTPRLRIRNTHKRALDHLSFFLRVSQVAVLWGARVNETERVKKKGAKCR